MRQPVEDYERIAVGVAKACDLLDVSAHYVISAHQRGELIARKCGNRKLIAYRDLLAWFESLPIAPPKRRKADAR
jgi:hypothetical protein